MKSLISAGTEHKLITNGCSVCPLAEQNWNWRLWFPSLHNAFQTLPLHIYASYFFFSDIGAGSNPVISIWWPFACNEFDYDMEIETLS